MHLNPGDLENATGEWRWMGGSYANQVIINPKTNNPSC
jgi:hypothetical protein